MCNLHCSVANQNRVIFSCGIIKLVIKTKLLDILCVDEVKTENGNRNNKNKKLR